jgi:hypothetical protein
MLRFPCVEPSERSCDSSTGQGERASVERPVLAGHLQNAVGLGRKVAENDERFILFISFNTW